MSEESTRNWREFLEGEMPFDTHEAIHLGVCDYLFSCTFVEEEDIYRAIKETYERDR